MGPLLPFLASVVLSVGTALSRSLPGQRFGDAGEPEELDELQRLWIARTTGQAVQAAKRASTEATSKQGGVVAPKPVRLETSMFRPLPYPDDGLEPDVGAVTMQLHHDDLAKGYADAASKALLEWDRGAFGPGHTGGGTRSADLQRRISWNVAGAVLHDLFFSSICEVGTRESGRFATWVASSFGSMEELRDALTDAAMSIRGQGWAVLAWEPVLGRMLVFPVGLHQDGWVPGAIPLLVIDVWEHAYYGDRGPDRAAYLAGLWKHVDWATVSRRLDRAYPPRQPAS